ncbi:hypothetical protein K443DRAFT_296700 [Laccaria amethystina LaAM-08-1]|uniref:Kinase n=1 Tax=Laccaria amethystina LaAM-08-1 TaxID=1095629 RepID=A0A0C9WK91_9AGAR|nr:hypothetical protein K443DRAFT_296700 [Laccaria amethystina LaAM-08-1]
MEKTARDATSFETGVRLTGFQVYDNATSLPVITPKSYGKSIKPSDLPDGILRFFPVGQAPRSSSGLPKQTLLPILRVIREDVAGIQQVFLTLEIRLVGGSLFIIYEADWARAENGFSGSGWTKATKARRSMKMKMTTRMIGLALHSSSKSLILPIYAWHQEKASMNVLCLVLILFLDCWMRGLQ